MFRDKFLVTLVAEHDLGPLRGERQLPAAAVPVLRCAAGKPDLPPGGRSHYSRDISQLQQLCEKQDMRCKHLQRSLTGRGCLAWCCPGAKESLHGPAPCTAPRTTGCRNGMSVSHPRASPNPAEPKANKMKAPWPWEAVSVCYISDAAALPAVLLCTMEYYRISLTTAKKKIAYVLLSC